MTDLTEQSIRSDISDLMADLMLESKKIKITNHPDMLKQGYEYISAHNKRLDLIMKLITRYGLEREMAALDVLLQDSKAAPGTTFNPLTRVGVSLVEERLAQITSELERDEDEY